MEDQIADRYWAVRFESRKRQFYYCARMRFWAFLDTASQILGLVCASNAFVAVTQGNAAWSRWAVLAVATISIASICMKAGERARDCQRLYMEFVGLEGDVPPPGNGEQTMKGADDAERKLRNLISADPWEMPCLDALCDNLACIAFGMSERLRLSWIERTIGRYVPIEYRDKAPRPEGQ